MRLCTRQGLPCVEMSPDSREIGGFRLRGWLQFAAVECLLVLRGPATVQMVSVAVYITVVMMMRTASSEIDVL